MKTDFFQSCGHCWVFQICWHIECSALTALSFRIWNSLAGIPSSPLVLLVVLITYFPSATCFVYVVIESAKVLCGCKVFVWIITNCGKLLKRWEYQTILPISWETCMQVNKQQLEPYMEQMTGSKLRREYDKAVYCHLCDIMWNAGWMSHQLESGLWGEISTTSEMHMIPL